MKMNENTMEQIAVLEEHTHLGPAGGIFEIEIQTNDL